MLAGARRRLARRARAGASGSSCVEGEAERLPFADGEFDHLTFTYLLRYVDDPARDAARAGPRGAGPAGGSPRSSSACPTRRSGGRSGALYTRVGLPALGPARSAATGTRSGRFLGPSIEGFYERWPLERQLELWERGRDRRACARGG